MMWLGSTSAGTSGSPSNASGGGARLPPMDGPVRCLHVSGARAWAGGGRGEGWVSLWSADSYTQLDTWEAGQFGPCHAMRAVSWAPGGTPAAPALNSRQAARRGLSTMRRESSSFSGGMTAKGGILNMMSLVGIKEVTGYWRLLTGHENGQVGAGEGLKVSGGGAADG